MDWVSLFIPINTAAYAFVKPNKRNQASGLINLSRNIGGSVGIALATSMLDRYAQIHQTILSAHMTLTNPAYQGAVHKTYLALRGHGVDIFRSAAMAPGMLYGELIRQSMMLAYVDVFRKRAKIGGLSLFLLFS